MVMGSPGLVVAALDPMQATPLGPFLPADSSRLTGEEIILADWPESPLTAKPGDPITIRYFRPDSEGKAVETSVALRLRAKAPLAGPAADPSLAPEFPGITDRLSLRDWDPPFPYDNTRITKR